jgi:hypothetical protein
MTSERDIVTRLRDPMIAFDYGDRLMAAEELERLRKADAGTRCSSRN